METVLAKPLSGTELVRAILYDLEQALMHDDRLAAHSAHNGFSYQLILHVQTSSGPILSVDRILVGSRGAAPPLDAPVTDVIVERPLEPPNQVRQDTEQPLPVLVENEKGKIEEKWVKYAKDGAKPGARPPKNKVLGG